MNVPALTGFLDEIALQKAIAMIVADDSRLSIVPVIPEIKLLQESELLLDCLWTLPRNAIAVTPTGWQISQGDAQGGLVGAGILIEMPEMEVESTNVSGPPAAWTVGIVAFQEPNTNFVANVGIGITSSQLCQIATDILHLLEIAGFGTFSADRSGIKSAHDWQTMKPGIVAHRLTIRSRVGRTQSKRSAAVQCTFGGGVCTLSCSDSSAIVRYTTDGSMPLAINPSAQIYSAPFSVDSGTTVTYCSQQTGTVNSQIYKSTSP
jgi:hypothetical protein